jgi:hypothetical protein
MAGLLILKYYYFQWDNTVGLWTYEGNHAIESEEEAIAGIESSDNHRSKRLVNGPRRSTRLAEKRARRTRSFERN